jgi:ketosteroid isomerase-like protein
MSAEQNIQVVKDAYAAFGRGDVNGILALLDDSVEWEGVKGTEGVAPHAGIRRGKLAVAEFFRTLATTLDFQLFEPREFVAQGDAVVVIGRYKATVKSTNRSSESDWVMVFNLRNGTVTRFREFTDSAAIVRSFGAAVGV